MLVRYTLVKCDNPSCSQYGIIKSIMPLYMGNGVSQRLQPVCTACDGKQDMVIVNEREAKRD